MEKEQYVYSTSIIHLFFFIKKVTKMRKHFSYNFFEITTNIKSYLGILSHIKKKKSSLGWYN